MVRVRIGTKDFGDIPTKEPIPNIPTPKPGPGSYIPPKKPAVASADQAIINARTKATEEGNAYIRQREKLAAQAGITPGQAAKYLIPGEEKEAIVQQNIKNAARAQEQLNEPLKEVGGNEATLGASLAGAAPDILAQAATGAAAGAVTGAFFGGVGAIPGAAVGAIAGLVRGVLTNLKDEEKQNVKTYYVSAVEAKNNIKTIINGVNMGIIDQIDAIKLYKNEVVKINAAERNLKMMSEREWLSKAKDELIKIQEFNGWERDYTERLLLEAIATPNPDNVLTMEQIEGNTIQ